MNNVSFPLGFKSRGVACGIKKNGNPDLGLLESTPPALTFGAFTKNKAAAASVRHGRATLASDARISKLLVNSGNANAATGPQGEIDLLNAVKFLQEKFPTAGGTLMCSTGVIGEPLPMKSLKLGIELLAQGNAMHSFHTAIMTTDTFPKTSQIEIHLGGKAIRLGGVAKGAGMICPNMATMLGFITTDIELHSDYQNQFFHAVEKSFNSISVDGETSTNDTVLLMANGASGVQYHLLSIAEKLQYDIALESIMRDLSYAIIRDGEGATKFITVEVLGAKTIQDAKSTARVVANSPLVKTAFFGGDPNWGRVLAAAGYSGAALELEKISLDFCGIRVFEQGQPLKSDEKVLVAKMKEKEVSVRIDLGLGSEAWTYWTCDLSYEYVKINGSYRS